MTNSPVSAESRTIGQYLIDRLQDLGLKHVFGIPGDYVLSFYSMLEHSPIRVIGCTREDCAGFAADAYARVNGLGAVCVTYCVGGLSLCNSIAGAYAEKSPVLVITGSPGLSERVNNPLLHHKVRDFRTQFDVFEKLTGAAADLTNPNSAFSEIDRVLDNILRYKRPGYIELPRDLVSVKPSRPHVFAPVEAEHDLDALREAVEESRLMLSQAHRPIIIAGVEIHRFHLQSLVLELAESANIPVASTVLGKSAIQETHPLYIGLYEGAMGREEVTRYVEESDCVLLLGAFMTDINLGIYTANLDPRVCIYATSEQLRIRRHRYDGAPFREFLAELIAAKPAPAKRLIPSDLRPTPPPFELKPTESITIRRVIARLNQVLDDETMIIADVGDSLFASTELVTRGQTEFLSPAYYTSMGFATPAALGAKFARPNARVIALVGDGAFQMTFNELGNIVRHQFDVIVIVMDNAGYGTERFLHPGEFNDIHPWNYHKLPEVFGGGKGYDVYTEGDFDASLRSALADRSGPSIIQVHLSKEDISPVLQRLADRMKRSV